MIRQKTIGKLTDVVSDTLQSPKSRSKSRSKNSSKTPMSQLKLKANENGTNNHYDHDSPRTTTTTGASSVIIPSQQNGTNGDNGYPITPPMDNNGGHLDVINSNDDKILHTIEMQPKARSQSRDELFIPSPQSMEELRSNSTNQGTNGTDEDQDI
eukprot:CAMPEP_0201590692 /NCGR_PEP_ID=MMETSP0190_2-20130828/180767_1 /ASSEMBLY_ACC=CAM_ASM_000263 /TAXON_ID=37353 /ORGANISM="Rosalina sp." /LENGTH=154 /DNA_ID=CAMNT_0048047383 /DNA_START=1207 /DNA_END=1671 /DNA_ORIENTATION=-